MLLRRPLGQQPQQPPAPPPGTGTGLVVASTLAVSALGLLAAALIPKPKKTNMTGARRGCGCSGR